MRSFTFNGVRDVMTAYYREPRPLPQVDEFSCYTNVIAQVRWMFGTSDRCDAAAVCEIDTLTRRRPDRPSGVQSQLLLLAAEGFRITDFDVPQDLARLAAEGVAYMRELHGRYWTPEQEAHWTPERVALHVRRCGAYRRRFERAFVPYRSQLREAGVALRLRYVDHLLAAGWAVLANYENGLGGSCHAALIYGRAGRDYLVYEPEMDGPGLEVWDRWDCADGLLPYASAVTLPAMAATLRAVA